MSKVGRASRNASYKRVETITGALADATVAAPSKTIGDAETGEVYFVNNITHDVVVVLPAVKAGAYFKFVIAAAADGSDKILGINTGDAAVDIQGTVTVAGDVFDVTPNTSGITMAGHGAIGPLQAGDWLEFLCDGTDWYVWGQMQTAMSLVIADGLVNASS